MSTKRITRCKTGCLTCRKRRKKCDERKPECGNCLRNKYVCEGYQQQVRWSTSSTVKPAINNHVNSRTVQDRRHTTVDFSLWQQTTHTNPSTSAFPDVAVDFDDHLDGISESHSSDLSIADINCMDAVHADTSDYTVLLQENDDQSLHQTLTDLGLPSEETVDTQVETAAAPPRLVPRSVDDLPYTITVPPALQNTLSRPLPCIVDGIQTQTERKLFDYYYKVVVDVLLLKTRSNPLAVALIPKALSDTTHTALLDAIMCLAASQYQRATANNGCFQPQARESASVEALKWARHSRATERHVQQLGLLGRGPDNSPGSSTNERQLLVLTMLLYQFSLCESNSQQTRSVYLSVARELVCQIYQDGVYRPELHNELDSFILDWFYYHDTCSSLTRPFQLPCIDLYQGVVHRFDKGVSASSLAQYCKTTKRRHDEVVLVGTWDGLLGILSRIIHLRRLSAKAGETESLETLITGLAIEGDLRDWNFEYVDPQNSIVAQCYRHAAFILLWFTMYPGSSVSHEKVQTALASSLELLQRLDASAHAQTCLLLPLFVFGVSTTSITFRELIELKIQGFSEWAALSNISEVVDFLREWWLYVDSLEGNAHSWWDWETYMLSNGLELLLV